MFNFIVGFAAFLTGVRLDCCFAINDLIHGVGFKFKCFECTVDITIEAVNSFFFCPTLLKCVNLGTKGRKL